MDAKLLALAAWLIQLIFGHHFADYLLWTDFLHGLFLAIQSYVLSLVLPGQCLCILQGLRLHFTPVLCWGYGSSEENIGKISQVSFCIFLSNFNLKNPAFLNVMNVNIMFLSVLLSRWAWADVFFQSLCKNNLSLPTVYSVEKINVHLSAVGAIYKSFT